MTTTHTSEDPRMAGFAQMITRYRIQQIDLHFDFLSNVAMGVLFIGLFILFICINIPAIGAIEKVITIALGLFALYSFYVAFITFKTWHRVQVLEAIEQDKIDRVSSDKNKLDPAYISAETVGYMSSKQEVYKQKMKFTAKLFISSLLLAIIFFWFSDLNVIGEEYSTPQSSIAFICMIVLCVSTSNGITDIFGYLFYKLKSPKLS